MFSLRFYIFFLALSTFSLQVNADFFDIFSSFRECDQADELKVKKDTEDEFFSGRQVYKISYDLKLEQLASSFLKEYSSAKFLKELVFIDLLNKYSKHVSIKGKIKEFKAHLFLSALSHEDENLLSYIYDFEIVNIFVESPYYMESNFSLNAVCKNQEKTFRYFNPTLYLMSKADVFEKIILRKKALLYQNKLGDIWIPTLVEIGQKIGHSIYEGNFRREYIKELKFLESLNIPVWENIILEYHGDEVEKQIAFDSYWREILLRRNLDLELSCQQISSLLSSRSNLINLSQELLNNLNQRDCFVRSHLRTALFDIQGDYFYNKYLVEKVKNIIIVSPKEVEEYIVELSTQHRNGKISEHNLNNLKIILKLIGKSDLEHLFVNSEQEENND